MERGTNPKDLLGTKKVSLSKFPAVALAHGAHAMMDGARKYNAYNWRSNKVITSIYIDAAKRHIDEWFDASVETASDSGVHHLGHAMSCLAIILDAQATGNLVNDRPVPGAYDKVIKELQKQIEQRLAEHVVTV